MKIIEYQDSLKEHIKRLNLEWIEKYFYVEPADEILISDPKTQIIDQGGFIYFAVIDHEIVGTVTLMKVDDSTYEIGKMAVTEKHQGKGIGEKLLHHSVQQAKLLGLKKLILYSNKRLTAAINLYRNTIFWRL